MLPDVDLFVMTQGSHYEPGYGTGPPAVGGDVCVFAQKPPQVPCHFESLSLLSRILGQLLPSAVVTCCFFSVGSSNGPSLPSNMG